MTRSKMNKETLSTSKNANMVKVNQEKANRGGSRRKNRTKK